MLNQDTIAAMEKSELDAMSQEKLFCCLYERYYEKALSNALFYCGKKHLAEDVMQDVFLKIWKDIDELQLKIKHWRGWHLFLFVLVRNRASNVMRKENNEAAVIKAFEFKMELKVYHDWALDRDYEKIFSEAVRTLSYQQKEIFVLKYYRFKPKVIGRELKLTAKTVSNTLFAARRILIENVNKEFEINEALLKSGKELGYSHKN